MHPLAEKIARAYDAHEALEARIDGSVKPEDEYRVTVSRVHDGIFVDIEHRKGGGGGGRSCECGAADLTHDACPLD